MSYRGYDKSVEDLSGLDLSVAHPNQIQVEPNRMVRCHCDVIDPDSGEVVAEAGDVEDDRSPKAKHVLAIVVTNPNIYEYCLLDDGVHIGEVTL